MIDPLLQEVLDLLNATRTRATYGAVAKLLGVEPISMGARLGPRRPEASWVVSTESELPSGYAQNEIHPELLSRDTIIREGDDLLRRLSEWRESRSHASAERAPEQVTRPTLFTVVAVIMALLAVLYLVGSFLLADDLKSARAGGLLGFAALFAAYSLSIFRLRRVALTLGWVVVTFTAFWTLLYPAPVVILAWGLHLWFVLRLRGRRSLLA